ncbi:MAG: hypothetical protein RBR29_03100, partial [Castellaniella sp.]|nr:hypothetical protein [Castellaniella sp.]
MDTLFDPKEHDDGNRQKGSNRQENRSPEVRIQTGSQEVRPGRQKSLSHTQESRTGESRCEKSRRQKGRAGESRREKDRRQKGRAGESRREKDRRQESRT